MPGGRESDLQARRTVENGVPLLEVQCHDLSAYLIEKAPDEGLIASDAHLEGVFQHQRQQLGRGTTAEYGAAKAGGQEVRDAPDVVQMNVGEDQCLDAIGREGDFQPFGTVTVGRGFRTLKQAAINQHRSAVVEDELVAGTGNAINSAVVDEGASGGHDREMVLQTTRAECT